MSRHRVIHDVQDVFVGSAPNESDYYVTGIAGHQVLKRLNNVQNFSYSINIPKDDKFILGQSSPFSRSTNGAPEVNFSLTYHLNGINNEKRIGLNTNNENENSLDIQKSFSEDMSYRPSPFDSANPLADSRNVYLVVNENNEDIRQKKSLPHDALWNKTFTKGDIEDTNAKNYNTVVFQNCYLTEYKISAESGPTLPTVDLNYIADNIVGYASGSGINIPYLDLKKGEITDGTEKFIIPSAFKHEHHADTDFLNRHGGGDVTVTINKRGISGASGFYQDNAVSCDISCSLQRESVANVGHKMISDRFIVSAVPVTLEVKTLVTQGVSGSFLDDLNENGDYDIVVDFKYKQVVSQSETTINSDNISARYTFSGAKFEGINYESSVNQNKTATMNFSTVTDFEGRKAGLFISGKVASYMEDLELNNGDNLTDNDGNNIISLPVYLQY